MPEITRADVAKFHHDLRHIPYQANRCIEVVSKMFVLAEMWGLRPDGSNPRKHIRKYPEEKRERFLSAAELRRIGEVLREMESERIELTSAILAARLLILTGCRLGEIMTLKWDYVDFDERALRLPDSKTGKKVVHFGAPAGRCCTTLSAEDSHCESMRLDGVDEQGISRPLPHDELVQLHCLASQARVFADLAGQGHDLARAA